jgi:hypothetical protein
MLHARTAGLFRRDRRGGRWTEKLLTLTVPHFVPRGDAVTARVEASFAAWRLFSLHLQKAWRERPCAPGTKRIYYRAFEWTPGKDRKGHPHFHIYLFSDFVPVEQLHIWWKDALRRAGVPREDADRAMCPDIKQIHTNPNEISRELLKSGAKAIQLATLRFEKSAGVDAIKYADGWTLAEYDDGNERIPSETGARLYEALEGRRSAQASRGFLAPKIVGRCWDCGETGYLVIQLAPEGAQARVDTRAQGPPKSLEQVIAEASRWGPDVGSSGYEPENVQRPAPPTSPRARELVRRLAIACRTLRPRRY